MFTRKKAARWIALSAWSVLSLALSRQTGDQTLEFSMPLARTIGSLLHLSEPAWLVNLRIRELAHLLVYFITGVLVTNAVCPSFRPGTAYMISAASGVIMATADEIQKFWISGRHCDWKDIALNVIGAAAGIACVALAARRKDRRRGREFRR